MNDAKRALSPQQQLTEFAVAAHAVARATMSVSAIEVLTHLIEGPKDVGALARTTALDMAGVSRRLGGLRELHLSDCKPDGSRRIYELAPGIEVRLIDGVYALYMAVPGSNGGFVALGIPEELVRALREQEAGPSAPSPDVQVRTGMDGQVQRPGEAGADRNAA